MSRGNKKKQEVDVSAFKPLVQEALRAFGNDVSYAVAMSKAAVTIERKRNVWNIRKQVTTAEQKARERCESEDFTCQVDNPCGTGDCKFAEGALSKIDLYSPGQIERPPNSIRDSYSLDNVVSYMHTQRLKNLARPGSATEEDES